MRRNSDGLTFDSVEQFDVLVSCCDVLLKDGDGGVSVIDGESANGPTRRAAFGGGLEMARNGLNSSQQRMTKSPTEHPVFRYVCLL